MFSVPASATAAAAHTRGTVVVTYAPRPDPHPLTFHAPVELASQSGVRVVVKCDTWATVGVPLPLGLVVEAPPGMEQVILEVAVNTSRWLVHGVSRVTLPIEVPPCETLEIKVSA